MRKVVTINLGGNAYQVDEDGYDALEQYLTEAQVRLDSNPDVDEIIADLERAIADKARRFLGANKTVVSGAEASQIIDEMGPVDMPGANEETADVSDDSGVQDEGVHAESARRARRLYRLNDRDDGMLAGVCAGLAAYTGIDVSILRILMIIAVLMTSGMAVIAYLVAVLVIPAAHSPEQLAAAYGAPFDAQDVIRQQGTEWHWRRQSARGRGHGLFRSVLALLLAGILFVFGLSFLNGMLRMFGMPLGLNGMFGLGPSSYFLIQLLVLLAMLGLVLWSLIANRKRGRSIFGLTLFIALHLAAIVVLSLFAARVIQAFRWIDFW